jgi:vanillate monooxygenase
MSRNFQMDDQGLTFRIRDGPAAVFAEDWVIWEAQQRSLLARPARELLNLKIDAGGTHARRIINRELTRIARTEAG